MKPSLMTTTDLKDLLLTSDPSEQTTRLRSLGLAPFVCPETGRPRIYREVVMERMLHPIKTEKAFVLNMEAFNGKAAASK